VRRARYASTCGPPPVFQERSARFLENHDEPRAASVFQPEQHRAAAAIAFLAPGLRFFHEGQLDGRRVEAVRVPSGAGEPASKGLYLDLPPWAVNAVEAMR
jgi:hypothetical protein